MAADEQENGTGSKDRATVSLVNSKIDTVLAKIEGNAETTNAKLDGLRFRIDSYSALPAQVSGLQEQVRRHEDEIKAMKDADVKRHEYRIGPLTANLIGFVSVCVAVIALVVATHG